MTPDQRLLFDSIRRWVWAATRRDEEGSFGSHRMIHEREEDGLKVVDESTIYKDGDAVGSHTMATYNGMVVFEQAGLTIKKLEPGAWMTVLVDA